MKRCCLIILALTSLNTGCIFGRSDGRPGFFTRFYNRIHGNDMGAPCASGGCGTAPMVPTMPVMPAMPPMAISGGCESCGEHAMGYQEFPSESVMGNETVYEGSYLGEYPGAAVVQPNAISGPGA